MHLLIIGHNYFPTLALPKQVQRVKPLLAFSAFAPLVTINILFITMFCIVIYFAFNVKEKVSQIPDYFTL